MLPEVTLRNVNRDDVDRVAWWLEDADLASKWFGHYGCGDPVHRGYDPRHMLEASGSEWDRVFGDSDRLIFSIYSEKREHIGECQIVMDGEGGAEFSLLIGLKDLWHHGYGTATAMQLLDKVFEELGVERAWVNVPEDNTAALGLFVKLGFVRESTRELCKRPDGTPLNAAILAMDARPYRARGRGGDPVVTVTGLAGSRSEEVGMEVARLMGGRFVDSEMDDRVSQRLRCSLGELESLEASYLSFWTRLARAIIIPMEWSAANDVGYYQFRPEPTIDYELQEHHITKKQYLQGLSGVVRRVSMERNVVLHGRGSHLFVPLEVGGLNVMLSASSESRQRRIAAEQGLDAEEARRWLERSDRDTLSVFKHLHGADLLDTRAYHLIVNMDPVSPEAAAQMVVGALRTAAPEMVPVIDREVAPAIPLP